MYSIHSDHRWVVDIGVILKFIMFSTIFLFMMNFVSNVLYYIVKLGIIFYDAFFFIFSFLGYHAVFMYFFALLLFGTFVFALIKFYRSIVG